MKKQIKKRKYPHGMMTQIAEKRGVTREYVSQVLNSDGDMYDENIVNDAIEYMEKHKQEQVERKNKIKRLKQLVEA